MKLKHRFLFDALLFVLLWFCMKYYFTGALLHELLGLSVLIGMLIHFTINLKYYPLMLKNLTSGRKLPGKVRFAFVLNVSLFCSTLLLLVSSFAISHELLTFLGWNTQHYEIWHSIHILSSVFLFVTVFVHSCMHLGMLRAMLTKSLRSGALAKITNISMRVVAVVLAIALVPFCLTALMHLPFTRQDNLPVARPIETAQKDSETEQFPIGNEEKKTESSFEDPSSGSIEVPAATPTPSLTEPPAQTEDTPSLTEYLKTLFCNGCGKHCSLLSPRCGKGTQKASQATTEYYNKYGEQ